jgi:hypothetical protein
VEEEEEEEEEDGEYADNAFAPAPAVTPTNETVKKRSIDEVNDDGAPQGAAEDGTAVRNGDAKKAKV